VDERAANWQLDETLVALAAGGLAGVLCVEHSRFGLGDIGMMVAADWRGRGVGAALVAAAIVVIERQHGTIGDLPEQDWSLWVTWVFRRTAGPDGEVVHRHADALVHAIDHERLGVMARGE
jgi:GNAT superfamily N-acetyltransferase